MSFVEKKTLNNLFNAGIVITILFLISISFYLIKVSNNDYCGVGHNYNIPQDKNIIYDTLIDSNDYLVQSIDLDKKDFNYYEYYDFCFNAAILTNDYVELRVVNGDGVVLGTEFYNSNVTGVQCIGISDDSFLVNNNLIGLECVNCDVVNNLTLGNSLSYSEVTISDSGYYSSFSVDYDLVGVKNCKDFTKTLFKFLILFILLFSLIWLINLLVDWFGGFAFDGW